MMKNKISFLVTFYNQEDYVATALENILKIKIPDNFTREILVGDDGSQDNTQKNIQKYTEKYPEIIRLLIMPRDKNTKYDSSKRSGENRLNLLKNATGDYFCISDGDDYYCDFEWILKAIPILKENKNLSLCAFTHEIINEKGEKLESKTLHLNEGYHKNLEYIASNSYIHAAAALYKMPNQKQLDFLIEMGYFVDTHIMLAFLSFGDIYIIPQTIYSYKANGGIWLSYTEFEQNMRIALSYCLLSHYLPQFKEEFDKSHYNALEFIYLNRKNFMENLKPKNIFYEKQLENPIYLFISQILNFDSLNKTEQKKIKTFFKNALFHQFQNVFQQKKYCFLNNLKTRFPTLKNYYKKIRQMILKKNSH